jgi:uncharacterized protein (TIGR01777 family)
MKKHPSTIVIAGGTGFTGRHVTAWLLKAGYRVVALTRQPAQPEHDPDARLVHLSWDGRTLGPWARALENAAGVVNLAGRNVNCRYTARHRREILESRLDSVRVLGQAVRQCVNPPPVWVQAATLAIHGHRGDQPLTEAAHIGGGFSPDVARAWEQAVHDALVDLPIRPVILRMSFVLGSDGGALPVLARLVRWGLGGAIGDGQQYYSWIHIHDVCRVISRALEDDLMRGVFHVTSPGPVRNEAFMRQLRRAVGCRVGLPCPAWMVHLGCLLMGSEAELALRSRRGVPARLEVMGFGFRFNHLEEALKDLLSPGSAGQASHHHTLTGKFQV